MVCKSCNSSNLTKSVLRMASNQRQTIVYCSDCGEVIQRRVESMTDKPKLTWEQRRARAKERKMPFARADEVEQSSSKYTQATTLTGDSLDELPF